MAYTKIEQLKDAIKILRLAKKIAESKANYNPFDDKRFDKERDIADVLGDVVINLSEKK